MDNIELFAEKIKQLSSCNYHFTNGGLISIKKNDTNKKKVMGNVGWLTYRKKYNDYKFEVRKDLAIKAGVADLFEIEVKNLTYNQPGLLLVINNDSESDIDKLTNVIKKLIMIV